ncbi:MAG: RNA polymerase-binding protein DksA, partial [Hylemonella sp.]
MKAKPAKGKTAAKTAVKKSSAKVAAKKSASKKPVPKKPVTKKPVAKKAAPKKVAAKKPVAQKVAAKKPVAKKVVAKKPVAKKAPPVKKAAGKAPVKTPAKKPAAKPVAKAKPAKPIASPRKAAQAAVSAKPLPVAPSAAQGASATPEKPKRPSSRLAQLTVPSMSQSVASTAAKASYIKTMPQAIAPTIATVPKKDPKLANNWKTKAGEDLSDAELLAMPDSEYMNEKQLAAFRMRLRQLKQDILNNAGETTEHLREDTVIVPDPADRATIEEEHALELRTRDRERKLLKKIEQSLAQIESGEYGYCDETGEPIGVGRLLARPTATLSLEAQQRRELK